MSDSDLKTRLAALEEIVAHQERTIEDLNTALTDQYREIEALKRRLAKLDDEVREIGDHPVFTGKEPPPPHY